MGSGGCKRFSIVSRQVRERQMDDPTLNPKSFDYHNLTEHPGLDKSSVMMIFCLQVTGVEEFGDGRAQVSSP